MPAPADLSSAQAALCVALGGAAGSLARWGVGLALARPEAGAFPLGTLAVNLVGSLAIGAAAATLGRTGAAWALGVTGALGGFTTFSAFSLDALALVQAGRTGTAALYVALSVGGGLAACALGWRLGSA